MSNSSAGSLLCCACFVLFFGGKGTANCNGKINGPSPCGKDHKNVVIVCFLFLTFASRWADLFSLGKGHGKCFCSLSLDMPKWGYPCV